MDIKIYYYVIVWATWATGFCAQYERETLEIQLTSDFIDFYEYRHTSLVKDGLPSNAKSQKQGGGRNWTRWAVKFLKLTVGMYMSVVSVHGNVGEEFDDEYGNQYDGSRYYSENEPSSASGSYLLPDASVLFVLRFRTSDDLFLFKKLFQNNWMDANWLLLADVTFSKMLSQVYLPISSKVIVAVVNSDEATAVLLQAYQVAPHLALKVAEIGNWILKDSLPVPDAMLLAKQRVHVETATTALPASNFKAKKLRYGVLNATTNDIVTQRTDMTGLHLRCSTIREEPYTIVKRNADGTYEVSGLVGEVFRYLQELTNFTSTCHYVKDKKFGSQVNGTWNGVVGEVLYGEADIGAASLSITQQRSTAVDYFIGFYTLKSGIFMKRPSTSDYMWTTFTKQFHRDVWILLGVFFIILTLCLYVSARVLHQVQIHSFADAALTIFGFLMGQGTSNDLLCASICSTAYITLTFHYMLIAYYTSDMISALASGPPLPSISGLHDVATDPNIRIGLIRGSAGPEMLKSSANDIYQQVYHNIRSRNYADLVEGYEEGMERVVAGNYLFMAVMGTVLYAYGGGDCQIYQLPTTYFRRQISMVIKKNSPLKPIFNKIILDSMTTGLLHKWKQDWEPVKPDCHNIDMTAIKLQTVSLPFLILAASILVSVAVIVVECLVSLRKQQVGRNYDGAGKEAESGLETQDDQS